MKQRQTLMAPRAKMLKVSKKNKVLRNIMQRAEASVFFCFSSSSAGQPFNLRDENYDFFPTSASTQPEYFSPFKGELPVITFLLVAQTRLVFLYFYTL